MASLLVWLAGGKLRESWSRSRSLKPRSAKTLPLGSVGYENATNEKGERLIWLDRAVVDRLRALHGPRESYSDVLLPAGGGRAEEVQRRACHPAVTSKEPS
jgi:hypothetical protein